MSIQNEIERLTKAKQDFKEKLIEKGVEVTEDELISDYPPKLDLIQTGVDEEKLYLDLLTTKYGGVS